MTKKMVTTAIVGALILTSTLVFAQVMPRGTSTLRHGAPGDPLPASPQPEVQAYLSLGSTQTLANSLNTAVTQAEATACAAQLTLLQQAGGAVSDAFTQLSSAWTEYDNQMALPHDQRNWSTFWSIMSVAQADLTAANDYYLQAMGTSC